MIHFDFPISISFNGKSINCKSNDNSNHSSSLFDELRILFDHISDFI